MSQILNNNSKMCRKKRLLKNQADNKVCSITSEFNNDVIRKKLDKAEKSGFTTESKSDILKQSKNS